MKLSLLAVLAFLILTVLFTPCQGLRTFTGDVVTINTPIEDDVFAAGNVVNINAAVDSAVVAGGSVYINAPIANDLTAAGGQVLVNDDVGGKIVAAGGNVNVGGNVGRNLVAVGGQLSILPNATVGRDAYLAGGSVVNSGVVTDELIVRAEDFSNPGSAGSVDFEPTNRTQERDRAADRGGFDVFGLLMALGYLILGIILLKYMPWLFRAVDAEVRESGIIKAVVGFFLIIASFIAVLILMITVIGIPIAFILLMLVIIALMLTGVFVSYSLGRWLGAKLNLKYSELILFVIGFVVLNILFLIPYVGGLVALISASLGFGAIAYAAREWLSGTRRAAVA